MPSNSDKEKYKKYKALAIQTKNKYLKYKNLNIQLREQLSAFQNNNQPTQTKQYNVSIQQPWFDLVKKGLKKVEGRLNKGLFAMFKKDDIVMWNNKNDKFTVKVLNVKKYKSFKEMLTTEGLNNVLPNIKTIDDGVNVYRRFYPKEVEEKYGVVAIHMIEV